MRLEQRPSPNWNRRPGGVADISAVVLHADASPDVGASISWCTQRESRVSYHTIIGRTGLLYALVPVGQRAWHAGVSELDGRANVNDFSVGVCLSNAQDGVEPFTPAQYQAGAAYVASLVRDHPAITLERIVTHAAVARPVGRKHDPCPGGPFDLAHFLALVRAELAP